MTRVVCLALAVAAGVCAALLLASAPTVSYAGQTGTCEALLVSAENDDVANPRPHPSNAVEAAHQRACDAKQREWSALAGLAALVCVTAGSVALLSRGGASGGRGARWSPVSA
ncbi:hypothetical protein ACT8ZV_13355 [Nocardioides sp. MAHUQ-72]|uniref:hypothetical protein n=1 Tax=unclassified Nocardioides TaxID=2615069 RepID=UPI00361B3D13